MSKKELMKINTQTWILRLGLKLSRKWKKGNLLRHLKELDCRRQCWILMNKQLI